jgi:hypothetical protein
MVATSSLEYKDNCAAGALEQAKTLGAGQSQDWDLDNLAGKIMALGREQGQAVILCLSLSA